jgi:patatin-related protein
MAQIRQRNPDEARATNEAGGAVTLHPTSIEPLREIRFAVVMYGGVSLAVYINGVAQELLHLVRATAPGPAGAGGPSPPLVPDDQLTGSEAAYRKAARLADPSADGGDTSAPITTRFVVDIISGSSAGGINGVFLGKALANDQPLGQLQQLWLNEGDIGVLINDAKSKEAGVALEKPPESLLNSRRMYFELLRAIAGMDIAVPRSDDFESPYVEELDVFVTTTDLFGLILPIRLENTVAEERRYRHVFHFAYSAADGALDRRNDFAAAYGPILAAAARCTSAFPFAFEPMMLADIDGLLPGAPLAPGVTAWEGSRSTRWQSFYRNYLPVPGEREPTPPYRERPMADGGALDNKPFSWATETLLRRTADVTVDRKLIYVEPDPRDRESDSKESSSGRPDALRNIELQGLSLPRVETIREDIERVQERNREIERIDRILGALDRDLAGMEAPRSDRPWSEQYLEDVPAADRPAYGGYIRLKVATVTDDLTELLSLVAAFDVDSSEWDAVRYLVRAWRDDRYTYEARLGKDRESFNAFLIRFDLAHRLRRLGFLMRRVDRLYQLASGSDPVLVRTPEGRMELAPVSEDERNTFRGELLVMKALIADIHRDLRILGRRLRAEREKSPLWARVQATKVTRQLLRSILEIRGEDERQNRAEQDVADRRPAFDALAGELADLVAHGLPPRGPSDKAVYGTIEAASRLDRAVGLTPDPGRHQSPGAVMARNALAASTVMFDRYDQIAFPLQYGADLGETDEVDIIRVSPEDATNLVDERLEGKKLHGWRYGHFGAFLDRSWRANDIMWGRLDAAEILIKSVVPEASPARQRLVDEAQLAIIRKEQPGITDLDAFRANYPTKPVLHPEPTARVLGRGAHVIGKMMNGIGERRGGLLKSPMAWIARVGAFVSALVEVALPTGWGHLVGRHLLALAYVFEGALVAGGLVFGAPPVQRFGLVALAVTVFFDLLIRIVGDAIRKKRVLRSVVQVVLILVVAVVLAMIAAEVRHVGSDIRHYWHQWTPW